MEEEDIDEEDEDNNVEVFRIKDPDVAVICPLSLFLLDILFLLMKV